jgi:hypothetical protein
MTDRGTYIHRRRRQREGHPLTDRQTDRGRIFIDDSGTDLHLTTEDVRSSTDGGCTFIDDGRGSSGTQPSRDRRCGRCVGVGEREREREKERVSRGLVPRRSHSLRSHSLLLFQQHHRHRRRTRKYRRLRSTCALEFSPLLLSAFIL